VVWAPYEFWEDGKTRHCGVEVLDLLKIDGEHHQASRNRYDNSNVS
jgi:hypothetical protein